ncbi:hypothetical protein [Sporosarcina sp. Te-1]|uniref:hypothetical protein n=1 Tax=Sporosarcina sp. Te-1 TaxID=2818390 RepID=UPI001A9E987A|nr:hypothetical protein [Sporosarcina sp. Te-1]QTD42024.1 hypothetical protein J3U78_04080 [Sporosarcina sp. Te-1]
MKKIPILLTSLLIALSMAGCSNKNTAFNNSGNTEESSDPYKTMENPRKIDKGLLDYFLPDGSKAHFQGEGADNAELDIDFAMPYENYVVVHENNGNAIAQYVYEIGEKQITTLSYDLVDSNTDFPTLEEIKKMEPVGVYLHKPFEKGQTFGQWEIVETDVPVETFYKNFDHAFVVQSTEPIIGAENKSYIVKKYFVEGIGEVKRESIMETTDGEPLVITSTLESVSKP